jgi:sulfoxide reductase catalytic subunit YedY
MLIRRKPAWQLPESLVTPEHLFLNRRSFMAATAAAALFPGAARAQSEDPSAALYPAKANAAFADAGHAVTPEKLSATYNNYYEFNTSKDVVADAAGFPIRPWSVVIDGEVEAPQTLAIDDLLKKVQLEECIYRHRCVETWSMVVPWTGFTVKSLVELARPKASAKYVRFESFNKPEVAPGQQGGLLSQIEWPYVEGLTMAEARNELPLMVTGAYGKPLPKTMGSPLRLHVPWKYGFKSIKGIVRISFVAERPKGLWEVLQPSEYGFWANVNPEVPHPRWSQSHEQLLGSEERIPTLLFNGYGEQVAGLYKGLEAEPLYM